MDKFKILRIEKAVEVVGIDICEMGDFNINLLEKIIANYDN